MTRSVAEAQQAKLQKQQEEFAQYAAQQEQLTQLTAALEHTTTSLQAAQALHAGTMQQLGAAEQESIQEDFSDSMPAPEPAQEVPSERRRWRWPWQR